MHWITNLLEWFENTIWKIFYTVTNQFWNWIQPSFERLAEALPDVTFPQMPSSIVFAYGVADYWLPLTASLTLVGLYYGWKLICLSVRAFLWVIDFFMW